MRGCAARGGRSVRAGGVALCAVLLAWVGDASAQRVLTHCGDLRGPGNGLGAPVMRGWLDPGQAEPDQRGRRADVEFVDDTPQVPYIASLTDVFGPEGIELFGVRYHWLYVNLFGHVSLLRSVDHHIDRLGLDEPMARELGPIIAPFDSRISAELCHPPEGGAPVANTVHWCHTPGRLVVTWQQVLPASEDCDALRAAAASKALNSFQVVIERLDGSRAAGDFAIEFRYETCDWMGATPEGRRGWAAIRVPGASDFPLARLGTLSAPDDPDPLGADARRGLADLCRSSNTDPPYPGVFRFEVKGGEPEPTWPNRNNDLDRDGLIPEVDNCMRVPNLGQRDIDRDGVGDVCDDDRDGDGRPNADDNCPGVPNPDQRNSAGDFSAAAPRHWCEPNRVLRMQDEGDACDDDRDGDGILDVDDLCVWLWSRPPFGDVDRQPDTDGDGFGDECDLDKDGDGAWNPVWTCMGPVETGEDRGGVRDNCPEVPNPGQENLDEPLGDTRGDACDADIDGDGVPQCCDAADGASQAFCSMRVGDARPDEPAPCVRRRLDGALISGRGDNCIYRWNPDQRDSDGDGLGDACDPMTLPTGRGAGRTLGRDPARLGGALRAGPRAEGGSDGD